MGNTELSTFMLMPLTPANLVVVVLLVFLVFRIRAWYRLSHIPGPLFHGISSLAFLRTQVSGQVHLDVKEWSEKYGRLFRVGPNLVLTSDVSSMQKISGVKSSYTKGDWYRPSRFIKGHDTSFSMVDQARHAAFRRKIAPAYAGSTAMEEAVDKQVQRLVDLITKNYITQDHPDNVKTMDLAAITHFFSLDVIGVLQFGKAFGFLDNAEDLFGFLEWTEGFIVSVAVVGVLTGIERLMQIWPFSEILPKASDPKGLGPFIALAQKTMAGRYKRGHNDEKDMIGSFMKNGVTEDEAVSQGVLQIVAGTDSVAMAIRMTVLYLSTNARASALLLNELDEAAASAPADSPIPFSQARRLPYLQAVIREGLRMYPGVIPLANKTVPAEGGIIAGYRLPAGTQVGLASWGAMRDKHFWGQDADIFRPERWLIPDEDRIAAMMECLDFQFGYGRYQCLGKPLVFMEMNKVIPELVRRFHFAVVDPTRPARIKSVSFYVVRDFDVVVTSRCTKQEGHD